MSKKLQIATVFSGIGAAEFALKRLKVSHDIVFACDNGEIPLVETDETIRKQLSSIESIEDSEIRRKNHDLFKINDEYDVQDISYLILRAIFPTLQFENPHFKYGGTNSKVDLMLESEGIDIELKMIKASDRDEKEFIKQLKIDFNDYSSWNGLKELIVFVYDPFKKTTNKNNFYELSGKKVLNNNSFNVHVLVSN